MGGMVGDTEFQAALARKSRPSPDDIALWPDPRAVPIMEAGSEVVEIVMMIGERHEIAGAGPGVKIKQFFGAPIFRLPAVVHLHETIFARVPVMPEMMVVLLLAL